MNTQTMPREADYANIYAFSEAWQAYLRTITDRYDRSLPFEVRRAFGTAPCRNCRRLSFGANGCTAGC